MPRRISTSSTTSRPRAASAAITLVVPGLAPMPTTAVAPASTKRSWRASWRRVVWNSPPRSTSWVPVSAQASITGRLVAWTAQLQATSAASRARRMASPSSASNAMPCTCAVPLLPERAAAQPAASIALAPSRSATTTSSTPSDSVRSRSVHRPMAPAPPITTTRIRPSGCSLVRSEAFSRSRRRGSAPASTNRIGCCTNRRTSGGSVATTVADLLAIDELALTLVAGGQGASRPIRWAHVSELKDPTRFLRGGEVLLTTGLGMRGGARAQAGYVEQLAEAKLAALGLGLEFAFEATPPAVVAAADRAGFPVFEVPFEVPFIAITEALFSRLVNEQYVLLQRAGTVQQTLSRLLLEGAGLDALLGAYARMTGTAALLFDLHGEVMASSPDAARLLDEHAALEA